jgi:hypothetical protein
MSTEIKLNQEQSLKQVNVSFFDVDGFALMQRIATAFSKSDFVPKSYQNNLPNCLIAIEMSSRLNSSILMVMKNLYVVHGNPGWSSQYLIATINTCGKYQTLRYEIIGDNPKDKKYKCRAWTIEKSTGEKLFGEWIDWEMVDGEGWAGKVGSKWKTMPGQMFKYRSAAFWCRAYAPEFSMGLQTAEEISDTFDAKKDDSGTFVANIDPLTAAKNARKQKVEVVDTESGVIDIEPIKMTYAEVKDLLINAKTVEELNVASKFIDGADINDELDDFYKNRLAELS